MAPSDFDVWVRTVDDEQKRDPLWRMAAFQYALFATELSWIDAQVIRQDPMLRPIAAQLYRAVGSIAANLAEGYSRGSGKDRVRLFEYALGSAREACVWYGMARVLEPSVRRERLLLLNRITRILLALIPRERKRTVAKQIST